MRINKIHFEKIYFGKILFGKIHFGKIQFGKNTLEKYTLEIYIYYHLERIVHMRNVKNICNVEKCVQFLLLFFWHFKLSFACRDFFCFCVEKNCARGEKLQISGMGIHVQYLVCTNYVKYHNFSKK